MSEESSGSPITNSSVTAYSVGELYSPNEPMPYTPAITETSSNIHVSPSMLDIYKKALELSAKLCESQQATIDAQARTIEAQAKTIEALTVLVDTEDTG